MFAGLASEIADMGDARPVEVAGRPLILARAQDGEIRAFHNVCPHRGARLLTEPVSKRPALTCPYHAWTYGLDGALRNRPHYDGPDRHNDGLNAEGERPCLFPVRNFTWHDWVFVNLDGKAQPFEDYIGEAARRFDGYDLSAFSCANHESFDFACNWKLAIENYCDFYHIFQLHPALHQAMTKDQRRAMECVDSHLFNEYWFDDAGHGQLGENSGVGLPLPPGMPTELQNKMVFGLLFPNVAVNVYPTNAQFVMFEPVSADNTRMHMWFYYAGDGVDSPAHKNERETVCQEWTKLNAEDEDICRRLQEGRKSDAYDGGRLAPYWDTGTIHYHRQIADAMRGEGAFANGI